MHRSEERDLGSGADCGSGGDRWVELPDLAGLEREYE